jgi:hypothetical protein
MGFGLGLQNTALHLVARNMATARQYDNWEEPEEELADIKISRTRRLLLHKGATLWVATNKE